MVRILYIIWLLLPLGLFFMCAWAVVKPVFGVHGAENKIGYFKQTVFCSVGLVLAICIDQTEAFESFVGLISFELLDLAVARWLLYPAILVGMAQIQSWYLGEKKVRHLPSHKVSY